MVSNVTVSWSLHDVIITRRVNDIKMRGKIQSEACQVLLPFFVTIHCLRLLHSLSRSKKEFRIDFHVSTWSKLLRTLISQFLVSNLNAVLHIQFWDSSDGDLGWSWRCYWHCSTDDKFPCLWNDSFFFCNFAIKKLKVIQQKQGEG